MQIGSVFSWKKSIDDVLTEAKGHQEYVSGSSVLSDSRTAIAVSDTGAD